MERLKELFEQLHTAGYRWPQINQIIRDAFGTSRVGSLSRQQQEQLIKVLEKYARAH
ncbi:hypothetical protein EDC14_101056 [Hydrogenispora ethanolica]|jgi:hypothetical protein|uniref:Uncharacterized protein n=1 Tax=Hydrogenispora ethanolica TaxID=1082276 RepID=A0A4V2QF03_HYDET|nr:hypothetical protein [Hydrogenispora ethanolica]TCL70067.1 hypothetical protein EDC14_101056 [Hydrogenispora ethanolica]